MSFDHEPPETRRAERRFAWTLAAVALASAVGGFAVAQYTSASRGAAAAPDPPVPASALAGAAAAGAGTAAPSVVLPDFADIAERANFAVVGISSTEGGGGSRGEARRPQQEEAPFHWFFGPGAPGGPRFHQRSMGSGFVISDDGYVITNNHVVEDAEKIEVTLSDDTKLAARLVGSDPDTDIALLKVDPDRKLPTVPLGDSDRVRVGEWVCAVGNPLAYEHTVTVGVLSAKGRRLGDSDFDNFLQTDAAINFGNSGGPLLNVHGEVIGVNTAISAQGQNIGFAVPINTAKEILPQLRSKGKVVRGFLGVGIQEVNAELQKTMKLPSRAGALVRDVGDGEPGDRAGLRAGDVIVEVDGQAIDGPDRLVRLISARAPGESVTLRVLREGKPLDLRATLAERKGDAKVAERPREDGPTEGARLGVSVADLGPRVRAQFNLDDRVSGVAVTEVDPEGPASDGTLRPGDVISEIDRRPVKSTADLVEAMRKVEPGDDVLLYVVRGGVKFWQSVKASGRGK